MSIFLLISFFFEESKAKAERTDFPQSGQKRPQGDGECKGLHPRMAWLLRNRKHKDNHAGMGWLAAPENPDAHLETMEEAEDESAKPHEARRPGMASLRRCLFAQILLEMCETCQCEYGYYKQETRTSRIL